jgi:hypothetical protein
MTMREIQDMTLATSRRNEFADQRFLHSQHEFAEWFNSSPKGPVQREVGFRVSAAPLAGSLTLPRLFGTLKDMPLEDRYPATVIRETNRSKVEFFAPYLPTGQRPILRGVRIVDSDGCVCLNLFADGAVEVFVGVDTNEGRAHLYLSWIAAYVVNVLRLANFLRVKADVEYGLELEVLCQRHIESITLIDSGDGRRLSPLGALSRLPLLLPRQSFGPLSDASVILTVLVADLCDATGSAFTVLPTMEIDLG